MSKFTDADNGLWQVVHDQYGKYGDWSQPAADAIVAAVLAERGPLDRRVPLMTMLATTWMNESTFGFDPLPNVNYKPESPWAWDVGPLQLNLGWTTRMAWQGEFKSSDLNWKEVFGQTFYEADGVTPCHFAGNVVTHLRCALRRLLAHNLTDEMAVMKYTGPAAQPHRLADWQKYEPLFTAFFAKYTAI